ncbi:hypothetical protein Syun_022237 [Stephania yunnanensis]|uniref:non-specific serine/threonine protein kinase n=1 Tax=Stephania yunnanensis TaxID=152371 RepID=A0AAP0IHV7_9MAGN
MHPLFLIIVIFILDLAACDDDFDPKYRNCTRRFECGRIRDIGYPFWGDGRADYCGGKVGYQLYCNRDGNDQEIPEIVINSVRYRVLSMSASSKSMSIARSDFVDDPCPANYINSTLDTSLFEYSAANTVNLTLFYDCVPPTSGPLALKQFTCPSASSTTVMYNYFDIRDESIISTCRYKNIVTQVSKVGFDRLMIINLVGQVLKDGFDVEYSMDVSQCKGCVDSGGQCGFDFALQTPTCFCFDGPSSAGLKCLTRPPTNKGKNKGLKIGIGIGTGVGGIILGCMAFLIWQRRKKVRSISSTLLSRNISPEPSSKPDIEKGDSMLFSTPIFTYNELVEATEDFDESKELGDGGFGTVYHGKLRDGREVAVKRLYEHNYKRVEQFMNEINILSRLRHKYLVSLYGCTSRDSRDLLLVYEFVSNGTVADHLHGNHAKAGHLTWPIRMSIAIESADALTYLHATEIIHRDVKTNNILLDNEFHVKVADFGLSRLFPTDVTHVSTAPQGTPGYVDPEYYQCYQLNDRSDVYSFGVVLIELISSKPAVDINRHRHEINLASMAINKIVNHALHELVDPSLGYESDYEVRRMVTSVAELAFRCLQQEKEMRPTMKEVLESLKSIEDEKYKREMKGEELGVGPEKGLLKAIDPPLSPDSVTDKWASINTTPNTSA